MGDPFDSLKVVVNRQGFKNRRDLRPHLWTALCAAAMQLQCHARECRGLAIQVAEDRKRRRPGEAGSAEEAVSAALVRSSQVSLL